MSFWLNALKALDPETAHNVALAGLRMATPFLHRPGPSSPNSLAIDLAGIHLPHPIGVAAGFDKSALAYNGLLRLGFSFVEVGSVTPKEQAGNPRPRVFRLPADLAVINRYGFNNDGIDKVCSRLARSPAEGVVGVNLGKNKDQADAAIDYGYGMRRAAAFARYLTINVSSPNTPGLRNLQNSTELQALLGVVELIRKDMAVPPIFLKIAPDLDDASLGEIVAIAVERKLAGLVIGNTTISRPQSLLSVQKDQAGGLSGAPLFELSTDRLRRAAREARGRLALIGVGGIADAAQAYAKIKAGASAVQLYTALTYQGPALLPRMLDDLAKLVARDGFQRIDQAVGCELA